MKLIVCNVPVVMATIVMRTSIRTRDIIVESSFRRHRWLRPPGANKASAKPVKLWGDRMLGISGRTVFVAGLTAAFFTTPAAARRHCVDTDTSRAYRVQPVESMEAVTIANYFLDHEELPRTDEAVRSFWRVFGTTDGSVAEQVANWNATPVQKQRATAKRQEIETLRKLWATIVSFENNRVLPAEAADLIAGKWNDWRSKHMSRAAFVNAFLAEVARRRKAGVPVYGAVLQAAQALINRLDDLSGAAGGRDRPEDQFRMRIWDSYIRRLATAGEISALTGSRDGRGYWDDYIGDRTETIRCVAALSDKKYAAEKIAQAKAEREFPTAGYSHPQLFRAIYDGKIDGMHITEVGLYMTAFVTMFTRSTNVAGCETVVSKPTLMLIAAAGSAKSIGSVFGGLAQAHRNGSGDRDKAFGEGFGAGVQAFGSLAMAELSGKSDAKLFFRRHGCRSDVARHFFANVSAFARQ